VKKQSIAEYLDAFSVAMISNLFSVQQPYTVKQTFSHKHITERIE